MYKSFIILILVLLVSIGTMAQSPNSTNYLSCTVDVAANFNLNTATLLENAQTISNCFHLTVRANYDDVRVYASIPSGITTSSGTPLAVSNVYLKFNHTNCPNNRQLYVNSASTPGIVMSTTYGPSNGYLFQQKKDNSLVADWYYDLYIPALGYSYKPGTYNYTFLFTMTQP